MSRPRLLLSVAAAFLLASAAGAAPDRPEDPWRLVDRVRAALEAASPLAADFAQVYLPAGFSTGESDSGRVALGLPRCLKWEYDDPFPRAYLLCGDVVWAWNEGEASGRRQRVAEEDQPGLDLLRLRVDALERRYRAELGESTASGVEIRLTPLVPGKLSDAVLTVDPAEGRVTALRYHDAEGNLTRFDFSGYQPLAGEGAFTPPALDWLDR